MSILSACARTSPPVTAPRSTADGARAGSRPPRSVSASDSAAATRASRGTLSNRPGDSAVVRANPAAIDRMITTLGDSTPTRTPAASTPLNGVAAAAEITWDIDVRSYVTHDRVDFYVQRFTGEARHRIAFWLERGRRYEPMIRAAFRKAGVPEDMYYLGLVESGYDPHAYSRAAAVGIWQFMTSTARGMGLRVDWWIDERRDPIRSTIAAARFLDALRDQFGSMYLAAAAYNGGPGRVSRGLHKFAEHVEEIEGDDRFFVLAERKALRSETSNYVPQLIAAALVGKDPARYGLVLHSVAPFAYDSVRVPAATPLAAVARASGVSIAAIKDLNPHILRGVTPLTDWSKVRVPVGTRVRFDSAFALLGDSERTAFRRIKAKKGATVATEAKKAGLTTTHLRWYNPKLPKTNSGRLAVGQVVLVPTKQVVLAAFAVPDPAVERYGGLSAGGVHIVRRGQTLSGIAARYGTSVSTLVRLNHLKKRVIYPGQSIIVRGRPKPAPRASASRGTSRKATPTRTSSSASAAKSVTPPRQRPD